MTRLGLLTGAAISFVAISLPATAAEMPSAEQRRTGLTGGSVAGLPVAIAKPQEQPRIVLAQRRRRGVNRSRARRRAVRRSRRRRNRSGRIVGGIAAAIIAGIIANELARANRNDWDRRCHRWYRRCDYGYASACRRFYRHCY